MNRTWKIAASLSVLTLALALSGCAARTPARGGLPRSSSESVTALRSGLDRIFSDNAFANAHWGVLVLSLDRGDTLYERNAEKLFMPASNNKLLTAAAALLRLGPEFRFETRVMTDGTIDAGVLKGNLVVVGGGDPTVAPRFHERDVFRVFRQWAESLRGKGIRRIEGDIIGDDRAFEASMLGRGWSWDYLAHGYAAPVSALQFNENTIQLKITPGEARGTAATIEVEPLSGYVELDAHLDTGAQGSETEIQLEQSDSRRGVIVRGSVPMGTESTSRSLAVEDPAEYFAEALRRALEAGGIDVSGSHSRSVRAAGFRKTVESLSPLLTHASPPLSEVLKPLLKVSQNLYSETLTRALGLALAGEGSFRAGEKIVQETLAGMAVEKDTYVYADGSGLSRYNLLSPDLLVRILKFMHRHRHFAHFYDALPIAGVDGTIQDRLKKTRAENNARAKTGSIANVRSLSGYVKTADGEMLAFSMIANNFLVSSRSAEYLQDSALELLAAFSRR